MRLNPRNDPRAERTASASDGESVPEAPRPVLSRLPAFYRENAELFAPLVDVAEDLLSSLEEAFRRLEETAGGGGRRSEPWAHPRHASGTAAAIARHLEERIGVAPTVWNGFEPEAHPAGGLVFVRSAGPSVVLAWERQRLPAPPTGFCLPDDLLPVRACVAAVLLGRFSRAGAPRVGERMSGEVFWRRGGETT